MIYLYQEYYLKTPEQRERERLQNIRDGEQALKHISELYKTMLIGRSPSLYNHYLGGM